MKLSKAIEILTLTSNEHRLSGQHDINQAEKLGFEAIKRIESYRRLHINLIPMLLPGETEE